MAARDWCRWCSFAVSWKSTVIFFTEREDGAGFEKALDGPHDVPVLTAGPLYEIHPKREEGQSDSWMAIFPAVRFS